ncbi:hypothetical protein LNTAR_22744 [Lentisphaera araneosa HTCC2155]|uniref:Cytoplasmic protein n=1 Tax=Lentisphaera araneosa HTCC2155 TaxID=313628 RepID=A6DGE0_9BACT|nr:hypothetical protein LNTAR_22744 [Lentisphaera araneosa HTCC2155]
MSDLLKDDNYQNWLKVIVGKIKEAQIKVASVANSSLILFYWELGRLVVEKQSESSWGDKVIDQLSQDLQKTFPDLKGLSRSNIKYCKRFYLFYTAKGIGQQAVDQLLKEHLVQVPWGHNIQVFTKAKNLDEAQYYLNQSRENAWSRDVLALQIKSNLYGREGKALSNFQQTLPAPQSDLAQQTLKDPYVFDFLTMTQPYNERDIELQLTEHITKFLLELGKGFAFVGRQYHLEVGDSDYYLDLLFYHIKLKCYVVVELKNTKFIPEYAGKLNFYLSAVDSLLKGEDDKPTIGILLCRDKNKIETEFALRDMKKPMGVSEFTLSEVLPEELKSSLPTIEEIELDMKNLENRHDA